MVKFFQILMMCFFLFWGIELIIMGNTGNNMIIWNTFSGLRKPGENVSTKIFKLMNK